MKRLLIILAPLFLMACTKENVIVGQPNIEVVVGNQTFVATLQDNAAANAFAHMLPLTLNMSELNSNEKYASLTSSLPTSAVNPGTINNGDIMLYGSSTLVLFYKTFSTSYSYTKIGAVTNPAGFQAALGSGSVSVTFRLNTTDVTNTLEQSIGVFQSNNVVYIEGEFDEAVLVDVNGSVVDKTTSNTIDLAEFRSGVYVLKIVNGSKIFSHKVVSRD